LLDNLDLQLAAEPDSDSGTDGPVDEGLISIHLPGGVFPNNVVFGGGTFLKINDRVSLLRTDEGHAAIACTGEPGVNIGASTPISPGVEMTEEMNEKSMSFLRAKYRALGEEQGHNPLIGEAMVDASIELYGSKETDGTYRVYKVEKGKVVESHACAPKIAPQTNSLPGNMVIQFAQPDTTETLRTIQEAVRSLTGGSSPTESSPPQDKNEATEETREDTERLSGIEGLPDTARLISPAGKLLTLTTREAMEIGLIQFSS
ncbi:MAG TPA: hypothetical protein PLC40_14795, partial [Candidatus Hydrogenedentes bacterium]|nr:hypothetical protein [Candidatus Hydrogenedentota bacterium]